MIITHRSGEPNDPVGSYIAINSLVGLPIDKAEVTEDHLIETAGFSKLFKQNDQYDKCYLPRLLFLSIIIWFNQYSQQA